MTWGLMTNILTANPPPPSLSPLSKPKPLLYSELGLCLELTIQMDPGLEVDIYIRWTIGLRGGGTTIDAWIFILPATSRAAFSFGVQLSAERLERQ